MENKKQTAVEWLMSELHGHLGPSNGPELLEILNQAKAMEREQIIDERQDGIDAVFKGYSISNEEYYTETFKTGQNESE
jgi:hypothetical protein